MHPRLYSTSQSTASPNSTSNSAASPHAGPSTSRSPTSNLHPNYTSHSTRQHLPGYHRASLSKFIPHHTSTFHEALFQESPSTRHRSRPMDPKIRPSGQMLFYLRDPAETDHTVAQFREKLAGPLGFDIEARPKFTKGGPQNKTALVQLASDSIILLVQVSAMHKFPETVRNIIEDPSVIKAGVGIKEDAGKLWKDFGVSAAGCLELGNFARVVDPPQWADWRGTQIGLARLVKIYEDRDLKKLKKIQMSNWELFLTDAQQDYAADDANAGLTLYRKLDTMLQSTQLAPSKESYIFRISHGSAITLSGNPFPPPGPKPPVVAKSKDPKAEVISAVKLTSE